MIEVEAKIKIEDIKEIRKKARALGKFIGKEKKVDDYYTLESLSKYPKKSLRIRKSDKNGYQVNFKEKLSYIKGIHAKNESEFKVSDINNFLELIKDFGFKKWLTKEKTSEIYQINKNFHIEINHVKQLGWFVEVEYLARKQDITKARNEVHKIVRALGATKSDIRKSGYTKMLWEKRH